MDTARSLCMLWIVAIWHMGRYMDIKLPIYNPYGTIVTRGVLATFTFLSGFFLGQITCTTRQNIATFYIKRLKRFYILYAISCISLYGIYIIRNDIAYISSFLQLLLSLTGLACFTPPLMPLTVWFLCMMIFLYTVTPLILIRKATYYKIFTAFIIYIALIIFYNLGVMDKNLLLYFPVYCLALLTPPNIRILKESFSMNLFLISFIFSTTCTILCVNVNSVTMHILTEISICILILEISKLITFPRMQKISSRISYASMCTYLFHRQYFTIIYKIFNCNGSTAFAWLIAMPLLIIICYFIQKSYDSGLDFCTIKMKINVNKKFNKDNTSHR